MTIAESSSATEIVLNTLPVQAKEYFDISPSLKVDKNIYKPKLIIRNLCKSFPTKHGNLQVLNDVNMTINSGELVCILGSSGCGKTTLLNILAGFEKPDSGEILGEETDNIDDNHNRNLMIFQEPSLFPWLNVTDNVGYGLKLKKIPRENYLQIVCRYLNLVKLGDFRETLIHQLSGGMKQRVVLARSLVMNPDLLLMDEPFAALDIQTRKEMYQLLLEVWQKTAKTILLISHNVEEAILLSDRVLIMAPNPGRIKTEIAIKVEHPRKLNHPVLKEIRQEIIEQICEFNRNESHGGFESEKNC